VGSTCFSLDVIMFFQVMHLEGSGNIPVVGVVCTIVCVGDLVPIVNVAQVVLGFNRKLMSTGNAVPVLQAT
jgi:hypothetical protein